MIVYLAGTISKDPKHLEWRKEIERTLDWTVHDVVSPLRFQDPTQFTEGGLHDKSIPDSFFVATDMHDVRRCDIVFLVFWRNSGRQSVGTWAEFGIAADHNKVIIVVTDDPDVADHPFILRRAAVVVSTIEVGMSYLKKALV